MNNGNTGRAMGSAMAIDLLLRVLAFLGLTSLSAAVLALPYLS